MKKFFLKLTLTLSLLGLSLTSLANVITFNGQQVSALDLNGVANGFVDFYNYDHGSAYTGLEVDSTIVMFLAEYDDVYALYTIANKAPVNGVLGGTRGLFKSNINTTTGQVEFLDESTDLLSNNMFRFNYAAGKTDGFIFNLGSSSFDFTQTISSVSGQTSAVGVTGISFINFVDGTLQSATYSDLMTAFGDFNVSRNTAASVVSAPASLGMLLSVALFLSMRRSR